jgi:hypothetical protein
VQADGAEQLEPKPIPEKDAAQFGDMKRDFNVRAEVFPLGPVIRIDNISLAAGDNKEFSTVGVWQHFFKGRQARLEITNPGGRRIRVEPDDVALSVATPTRRCERFGRLAVGWQSREYIEGRHTVCPLGHNNDWTDSHTGYSDGHSA